MKFLQLKHSVVQDGDISSRIWSAHITWRTFTPRIFHCDCHGLKSYWDISIRRLARWPSVDGGLNDKMVDHTLWMEPRGVRRSTWVHLRIFVMWELFRRIHHWWMRRAVILLSMSIRWYWDLHVRRYWVEVMITRLVWKRYRRAKVEKMAGPAFT